MERMMKLRDELKKSIEETEVEMQSYVPVKQTPKNRTDPMNVSLTSTEMV